MIDKIFLKYYDTDGHVDRISTLNYEYAMKLAYFFHGIIHNKVVKDKGLIVRWATRFTYWSLERSGARLTEDNYSFRLKNGILSCVFKAGEKSFAFDMFGEDADEFAKFADKFLVEILDV